MVDVIVNIFIVDAVDVHCSVIDFICVISLILFDHYYK